MRSWVIWIVGCTWALTVLAIFILSRIHPPATVCVSLYTQELSFLTDAKEVLGPMKEDQLIITRISKIEVDGEKVQFNFDHGSPEVEDVGELYGLPGATCSFYVVRSSSIQLLERLSKMTFWKLTLIMLSHSSVMGP